MNLYIPKTDRGSPQDPEYQSTYKFRKFAEGMKPLEGFYNFNAAVGMASLNLTGIGLGAGALMGIANFASTRKIFEKSTSFKGLPLSFPEMRKGPSYAVVGLGMAAAAAAGLAGAAFKSSRVNTGWSVSKDPYSGNLQVENPRFMGATGNLGLNLYRNRHNSLNNMLAAQHNAANGSLAPLSSRHLQTEVAESSFRAAFG